MPFKMKASASGIYYIIHRERGFRRTAGFPNKKSRNVSFMGGPAHPKR